MAKNKQETSWIKTQEIEREHQKTEKRFKNLIEKFIKRGVDIKKDAQHIIITRKSGKISYIRKWDKIPYQGEMMDVEDYIDMILAEDDE